MRWSLIPHRTSSRRGRCWASASRPAATAW
jgi:hypothetical protein